MANRITRRLASGYRAVPTTTSGRKLPGLGAGFGNTLRQSPGGPNSLAATSGIVYSTPGMPKPPNWDGNLATLDYLRNVYVMRSFQTIADTIANLPYITGMDPENPSEHQASPLSKLLGPASPTSPGGPNPTTSSSSLWQWSIVQKLVTGKMAWQTQRDPQSKAYDGNKAGEVFALWPLVAAVLFPKPSPDGAPRWFDGFEYRTPMGPKQLTTDQVFYSWKSSQQDWREPESVLQSIQMQIGVSNGIMRYMYSLLRNDMVASKLIVAPPFDEDDQRRAWEDQVNSEFSGFNNAGKAMFAYAENDYDPDTGKMTGVASVDVKDLAMTHVDAQMIELMEQSNIDISIGTGVPISLIGNASQRTFSNADSEYRNYWTIRILGLLTELQDPINVNLAPQLGPEVGWFDLSRVVALQPPTVFAPPDVKDMLDEGVITTEDVANILNLPALENPAEDTSTAPVGEEAIQSGAMGGRSLQRVAGRGGEGYRAVHHGMRLGSNVFVERKPLNTFTLKSGVWKVVHRREHIKASGHRAAFPEIANETLATVARIRGFRSLGGARSKLIAAGIAVKAADTGRVLMLQRSIHDPKDHAAGKFEFPGGHIEPGEDSLDAAQREWTEEVGLPMPDGNVAGSWTSPNGIYRGHVHVVPSESDVAINPDKRKVRNSDDPKGKYQETAVWMDPDHLANNPAVRDEVTSTLDASLPVIKAAQTTEGIRSIADTDEWFAANSERFEALVG